MSMRDFGALLTDALRRTGAGTAMRYKRFGLWHPLSGETAARRIDAIALGLRRSGVEPGKCVALYGGNCLEWVLADIAIVRAGATSAGLDGFADAEDLRRCLRDTKAVVLFVEGEARLRAALGVRAQCPALREIVLLRRDWRAHDRSQDIRTLADLEGEASASTGSSTHAANDPAIILYSAGTTAPARGVVLPHATLCAQVPRAVAALGLTSGDERLSLMPIHHVAERITGIYAALAGGAIVNFPESPETAQSDLAELQPSIVQLPPRAWAAMRSGIALTLEDTTTLQRRLVRNAMRKPNALTDAIVLRPIRRRLGLEGARLCLSSGGPTHPDVAAWFHALGRELHDLYALAETGGAVAFTPLRQGIAAPTVLQGIELSESVQGEIRLKARDLSSAWLDGSGAILAPDEWFSTGDRADGARLAGRVAHAVRTRGETIYPHEREQALLASRYVADAFVACGNDGLTAVLLLDGEQVAKFAQNASVPFTHFRSLTEAAEIRALMDALVAEVNRRFPAPRIERYELIDRALGPGDAEIGPTMALRRYRLSKGPVTAMPVEA